MKNEANIHSTELSNSLIENTARRNKARSNVFVRIGFN